MAEAADSVAIECGYCLSKDEAMQDPRVLPCSHVSCRVCLAGQLEKHKVVRCPHCKEVFDVVVDSLPTYKPRGDSKYKCDICDKKGTDEAAVMYCNSCTKFHCDKHQQFHAELHENHIATSIGEYKTQPTRLETTNCTEHKDQIYSLGCAVCLCVFCVSCITAVNICTNGKHHNLLNLGDLVTSLTEDIERLIDAIKSREKQLSALFKKSSKLASEYETETKEMVDKLHETRDKQIHSIQMKYKEIEGKLIANRRKAQEEMVLFMEDAVGTKLTILEDQRALMESSMRKNHRVDIVNTYRDFRPESGPLPCLAICSTVSLCYGDERRQIEAKLAPAEGIYIDYGVSVELPPTSLTTLHSRESNALCTSVYYYDEKTYMSLSDHTVGVIDIAHNSASNMKTLATMNSSLSLSSITVYQDRIYVLLSINLVSGSLFRIHVHDLSGELITHWSRSDKCVGTKLASISDQLIVPDTNNKRLTLYSLTGKVVKHIACPLLDSRYATVRAADRASVIIALHSKVFKVNITTGKTSWICKDVCEPQGLAMYGEDLVCIAGRRNLSFLNVNTGSFVSEMATDYNFVDVDIHDNILIASVNDAEGYAKVMYCRFNK